MKSKNKRDRAVSSQDTKAGHKSAGPSDTSGVIQKIVGLLTRYDVIILFILLFIAYNTVTGIGIISGDVVPASFLPASILENQNLNFDYNPLLVSNPDLSYAFPLVNGHYVSLFPIVTPILVMPVYGLSYLICNIFSIPLSPAGFLILAKTSASVIAALAGVFFYLASKELFSRRVSLVATCIFAFATSTWSISSQALWQHGTVELLLIVLIYLVVRNEKKEGTLNILLLGIVSGLFIFNRPPDSVLLIPVLFYILWYQKARLIQYISGGIIGGLPFLYYNYSVFGNVFGGYSENIKFFFLNSEFIKNYIGLLIAPNTGLFIFCPVLIVSVAGFFTLRQINNRKIRQVMLVFGPVILLQILVYSFFSLWDSSAAFCYGPRFLTGFVPVLGLYTGFFLNWYFGAPQKERPVLEKNIVLVVIGLLLIVSIVIQFIGAFYYLYYPDKSISEERAWNWSDSIITGTYSYGAGNITGITIYTLPPLPPLFEYQFRPAPAGT
jgi:hypothetical protein